MSQVKQIYPYLVAPFQSSLQTYEWNEPNLILEELPDLEKAGNTYSQAYKKILEFCSTLSSDQSMRLLGKNLSYC